MTDLIRRLRGWLRPPIPRRPAAARREVEERKMSEPQLPYVFDDDTANPVPAREQPPFEFSREHDGTLSLSSAVFQSLGAASVCWDNMSGAGVFDSTRAKAIGDALLDFIAALLLDRAASYRRDAATLRAEDRPDAAVVYESVAEELRQIAEEVGRG